MVAQLSLVAIFAPMTTGPSALPWTQICCNTAGTQYPQGIGSRFHLGYCQIGTNNP